MLSFVNELPYLGLVTKVLEFQRLVLMVKYKQCFYGFDMARRLEGLLAELLFGNIGAGIPTYVRNDNSAVAYQVDSSNTVANEKRLNGFLDSNR